MKNNTKVHHITFVNNIFHKWLF